MSSIPKGISFIIPTYNRGTKISNAVQSIIDQNHPTWELIIVDDGSTDDTRLVIKPYTEDERIKYVYQDHAGVSTARNTGAQYATGQYLVFLDSDDRLYPGLIEELYANEFFKYDLIFWEIIRNLDGKITTRGSVNLGAIYNGLWGTFLAGSVCYRKELFLKIGGYDPLMSFGENYELGLRIAQVPNLKIKYFKKPFLEYVVDSTKRTSNSFDNRLHSHLHQLGKHEESYKTDPKSLATIYYLIAFIYEKTNERTSAIEYFKKSWLANPWNVKPVLKIIYLTLIK
ncbi:MAG: glycosyltransferase family A protein [Christiangramia sp.]|nr:glycosyltransferase family A protein [Christiangramia sp.]